MKNNVLIVAALAAATASFTCQSHAAPVAPVADAQASMQSLLNGEESRRQIAATLDLANPADAARLQIGAGLHMQLISARQLTRGAILAEATESGNSWRFLLTLDGQPVGMATVEPSAQGGYAVVDIGAKVLAERVASAARQQPGSLPVAILRSREAMTDALAFGKSPAEHDRYIPMTSSLDRHATASSATTMPTLTAPALAGWLRSTIAMLPAATSPVRSAP